MGMASEPPETEWLRRRMELRVHGQLEEVSPIPEVDLRPGVEAGAVSDGIQHSFAAELRLGLLLQVKELLGCLQHRLPQPLRHAMIHHLQYPVKDACVNYATLRRFIDDRRGACVRAMKKPQSWQAWPSRRTMRARSWGAAPVRRERSMVGIWLSRVASTSEEAAGSREA